MTWYFGERAALRREKAARSERLLFENLAKRRAVYEKLYQDVTALERYYEPYRSGLSEFDEQKEPADFAPLRTVEEFRIQVGAGELWLDAPTQAECQNVLRAGGSGMPLALAIARLNYTLKNSSQRHESDTDIAIAQHELNSFSSEVSSHAEGVLLKIASLKAVMRHSLGLDSLDREVAAANAQSNAIARTP